MMQKLLDYRTLQDNVKRLHDGPNTRKCENVGYVRVDEQV